MSPDVAGGPAGCHCVPVRRPPALVLGLLLLVVLIAVVLLLSTGGESYTPA